MSWALIICTVLQAQSAPNPRSPTFTTGPTTSTTQPPARPSQFTTGTTPSTAPAQSFTGGPLRSTTGAPSFTTGSVPGTSGAGTFTTGATPSNSGSPSFTSGPVPFTTGAFAQPLVRIPIVSDGVIVNGVFIPMQLPPPSGPARDVYLPLLETRLVALDARMTFFRTRAFEHSGADRNELQRVVEEAGALLQQARDAQGSLRNVLVENFPAARDQMEALLFDVTQRLDLVESRLGP